MAPDEQKLQMHAWLSEEALAGWRSFAKVHSTNMTALLEALGRALAKAEELPLHRLPPMVRGAVRDAQSHAGTRSTRPQRE